MRVMSWNVWWRFGNHWRERQPAILATLARLQPDIVGLQEAWVTDTSYQARVFADALGMHSTSATPSFPPLPVAPESADQEGVEIGVGLISRWPILSVRENRLPAVHRFQPVTLLATLDHPFGPLHAVVSCTEWEPEFSDDHLAQTRALAALIAQPELDGRLPVILTADLNARPGSAELQPLMDVMFDTWVLGGGDPTAVTLSSVLPFAPLEASKQIDQRIDYILVRAGKADVPIKVDNVSIVDEPVNDVQPSDHFAVVADLDLS
jgi:endonuclease/exonuclease/phosphatase family metal-dependent hydrolase